MMVFSIRKCGIRIFGFQIERKIQKGISPRIFFIGGGFSIYEIRDNFVFDLQSEDPDSEISK